MNKTIIIITLLISSFGFSQNTIESFNKAKSLFFQNKIENSLSLFKKVYRSKKHPDISFWISYCHAILNNRNETKIFAADVQLKINDLSNEHKGVFNVILEWLNFPYSRSGFTLSRNKDSELFALFAKFNLPIPDKREILNSDRQNNLLEELLNNDLNGN